MSDRTCYPDYLLPAAEAALSPVSANEQYDELFAIAPNPFEAGRQYQRKTWMALWNKDATKLIWC